MATLASADFGQPAHVPATARHSSQLVQPVVRTGLNAQWQAGLKDVDVQSRKVSAFLKPCIFLAFTLSPALSQGRQDPGPLS